MSFAQSDLIKIYPSLENYALSLTRNPDSAKELTQQVILKVLENIDKFTTGTNLKAWVMTVMRNLFLNDKNKDKRVRDKHEYLTNSPSYNIGKTREDSTPINEFYRDEIMNKVLLLTPELKEPMLMFIDGFKYREIAEKLQLPMGTIKSRIFLARKQLKDMIEDLYGLDA